MVMYTLVKYDLVSKSCEVCGIYSNTGLAGACRAMHSMEDLNEGIVCWKLFKCEVDNPHGIVDMYEKEQKETYKEIEQGKEKNISST